MKYIPLLFIILVGCSGNIDQANELKMSTEKVKTIAENPENPIFINYPQIALPIDFLYGVEDGIDYTAKNCNDKDQLLICGKNKVDCQPDEEAFYVGKYDLESGFTALFTFITGDFSEQLVLSIHDSSGTMKSHIPLMVISEELSFGYSTSINKKFKINRSKVFYLPGTSQLEVDSEEYYLINNQGQTKKISN